MSAPAVSGEVAGQRNTMQLPDRTSNALSFDGGHTPTPSPPQKSPPSSRADGRQKRQSRMSIGKIFPTRAGEPPAPFGGPRTVAPPHASTNTTTTVSTNGVQTPPTRKLRKTRSNPQLSAPIPTAESSSASAAPQPPTPGARVHSHSVTAADMPRLPVAAVAAAMASASGALDTDPTMAVAAVTPKRARGPRGDIFSDVMQWSVPSSPYNSGSSPSPSPRNHSHPYDTESGDESDGGIGAVHIPRMVMQPFGPGVTFDSPSRKSDPLLITPPVLREMQSFESGLTAKADPDSRNGRTSLLSPLKPFPSTQSQVIEEPLLASNAEPEAEVPSVLSPATTPPPSSPPALPRCDDPSYLPSVDTQMHTRYPTEVFDVLQTYRGLPLLDRLFEDSTETTVIKMSANADETAAPRDDPRFVIWGEFYPDAEDHQSNSQESQTNLSSSRSGVSRRKSTAKGNKDATSDGNAQPKVRVHSPVGPQKVLVAATIERWIAQLTSDLNYDELLIFFLTYRTYISAVDLCHLLICRFHWALGQPSSKHDEMVKRIVRVRTFVALRYWLLTFFAIDFMPNRDLRLLLASWLNTLKRDPILLKHSDGTVSRYIHFSRATSEGTERFGVPFSEHREEINIGCARVPRGACYETTTIYVR